MKLGEVYLHIDNGGIIFRVKDDKDNGPTIEIIAKHFGQITNHMKIHTNKLGIKQLATLFKLSKNHDFKDEFVYAARPDKHSKVKRK